jgi:hypothetical protein
MTVTINIPSQLPALTGNANLFLRVNAGENGIEWAATAGGGITIGTTAIASGAVNRVLFEGAGNVVQQNAAFVWNNTDNRLILGTESSADTNSRLVVIGKGTGTNTTFAVHNSTGTNNALVVLDNSFVGMGIAAPASRLHIVGTVNSEVNLRISNASGTNGAIAFGSTGSTARLQMGSTNGFNCFISVPTHANGEAETAFGIANNYTSTNFSSFPGILINPSRTFQSLSNRIVFQTTGGAANGTPRGFDFALNHTLNQSQHHQEEQYRFFTLQSSTVTKRFVIKTTPTLGDSTTIPMHEFVNSRLGITDGAINTADNSALLKLESVTRGFLPPRMTGAQAEAIATPAEGLMVYATNAGAGDITAKGWWGYDGTNWLQLN